MTDSNPESQVVSDRPSHSSQSYLTVKRGSIKARLTRDQTYLNSINQNKLT